MTVLPGFMTSLLRSIAALNRTGPVPLPHQGARLEGGVYLKRSLNASGIVGLLDSVAALSLDPDLMRFRPPDNLRDIPAALW